MFEKGMNMIPGLGFRYFGILIVGLAGLMSAACFAAEPAGGKKFSLVYLVGVEEAELKTGVAAFVEPMFFTDGKELVFVYDYCRRKEESVHTAKVPGLRIPAQLKGKRGLADQEIAEDLEPIRSYCANRRFRLNGEAYKTLNNLGMQVRLGEIAFSGTGKHDYTWYPPEFPDSGTATITGVEGPTYEIPGRSKFWGPKHFFLASRNSSLLAELTPVRRTDDKEFQRFVERANTYGNGQKGMSIPTCLSRNPKNESCSPFSKYSTDGRAKFVSAELGFGPMMLGDVDGDGLTDAIVGLRAFQEPVPIANSKRTERLLWSATAFLLGNGNSFHIARVNLIQVWPSGFYYYMPLALLRMGGCSYMITSSESLEKDLLFLAQPKESGGCANLRTLKRVENVD
ncbi:MAG: hypothetical protein E6H61_02545 [Betaproteobacteria bacterium]|nr:MAG: hypothetical protein E6H61_02545 [Betaproteobacteria bacterium]